MINNYKKLKKKNPDLVRNDYYNGFISGLDTVLEDIFSNDTMECIRKYYPNLDVFIPALNLTKNSYKVFATIIYSRVS